MPSPAPTDFNPYQAPVEASVPLTGEDLKPMRPIPWVRAPLWRRVLAGVVDLPLAFACGLIGFGVLFVIFWIFDLEKFMRGPDAQDTFLFSLLQLTFVVMLYGPMLAYYILLECSPFRATLGKSLFGIAVVDTDGHRVRPWRSLLRTLVKAIGTLVFGVGLLWIVFTRDRQALHDRMADTVVVLRDGRASS